ncbi:MAG: hypothetical protein ACE5OY_02735 [Candidatus Bathyarchaeia archaeon]
MKGRILCFILILILSFSIFPIEVLATQGSPTISRRVITRDYRWSYRGYTWTLELEIPLSHYNAYRSVSIMKRYDYSYLSTTEDHYVKTIADTLEARYAEKGWDHNEKVDFILAFVQSLPYTSDEVTTEYDDYPRFPLETLVDNGGDCEDTSILFASLISVLGYDAIYIQPPGHLAVGVWSRESLEGGYVAHGGRRYYYCETAGEGWRMGGVPREYQGVGTQVYEIDTSRQFELQVSESSISCSLSGSSISYGQSITVSGSIVPLRPYATVTLRYTAPDGYTITHTVQTDADGGFRDVFTPDKIGLWRVKASWAGDEDHYGSKSSASFELGNRYVLEDLTSPFSLPLYPHGGYDHSMLYLTRRGQEPVTIKISFYGAGVADVLDIENNRFLLKPSRITNSTTFTIYWDGRGVLEPRVWAGSSIASIVLSWVIPKPRPITCYVSKQSVTPDQGVIVYGSINPTGNYANVNLRYTRPDGYTFTRVVDVDRNGNFIDVYKADMAGEWKVKAIWDGGEYSDKVESFPVTFVVGHKYYLEDLLGFFRVPKYSHGGYDYCMVYMSRWNKEPVTVTILFSGSGTVDVYDAENDRFLLDPITIDGPSSFTIDWDGLGTLEPRVWAGSSIASIVLSWVIPKPRPITCYVSKQSVTPDQGVIVYGSINPGLTLIRRAAEGYTKITLKYTRPDGYTFTRVVFTDTNGNFRDVYKADMIGQWTVRASWEGGEYGSEVESPPVSFVVRQDAM